MHLKTQKKHCCLFLSKQTEKSWNKIAKINAFDWLWNEHGLFRQLKSKNNYKNIIIIF